MAKAPPSKPHPKIYCGTTERVAKVAPVAGIPLAVEPLYLTDVYPGFLAFFASTQSADRFGIIEIDLTFLDQTNFLPCEWYLEATSRQKAKNDREQQKRREAFRKNLRKYESKWKKSLQEIGVIVYDGPIPKKAISRITIYDPASNPVITEAIVNQRITLSDYKRGFARNKAVTRWLIGDEISVDEWLGKEGDEMPKEEKQRLAEWLQNKSGLDIFFYEPPGRIV